MTSPNELVRIQVRAGDLPVLLEAIESRLDEHARSESCGDANCQRCEATLRSLLRMRDTLLKGAPKVEATWR